MSKRVEHILEDGVEKKKCSRCKVLVDVACFPKNNKSWDKLFHQCKACRKQAYIENKKEIAEKQKEYHQKNREKRLAYLRGWQKENREYLNTYARGKYQKEKEEGGAKFTTYKLVKNLRSRVWEALKKQSVFKNDRTFELLGCDIDKFKAHLESHFDETMTFSHYGLWHCDHKLPVASFDMTTPLHVGACFHYKNMRPLWADDNCRKNDKYDAAEWKLYLDRYIETYVVM